jgi:hypothetical protein
MGFRWKSPWAYGIVMGNDHPMPWNIWPGKDCGYPPAIKNSNWKSPINYYLNGKIIYK